MKARLIAILGGITVFLGMLARIFFLEKKQANIEKDIAKGNAKLQEEALRADKRIEEESNAAQKDLEKRSKSGDRRDIKL